MLTHIGNIVFTNAQIIYQAMECSTNPKHRNIPAILTAMLVLASPPVAQAQFTFATNSEAITITGYTGSGGNVSIPSIINGYPVTAIGGNAFSYKEDLTGVTIPEGVTSIGSFAFAYSGVASVSVPSSVSNLDAAFMCCPSLTNIAVDIDNPHWRSVGGVLFNKTMTTLVQYPGGLAGSYVVPDGVTDLGSGAFYFSKGLTGVTMPNSVVNFGGSVFAYCSNLRTVTMGNRMASIGWFMFNGCSSLKSVTIPDSVASIDYGAFSDCTSLTSVTIPRSVNSVASEAFFDCRGLRRIYFEGNAPSGGTDTSIFYAVSGTVYYLPGTAGWRRSFGGLPTALWYQSQPNILGSGCGLEMQPNGFAFTISWATNTSVVVEVSTNLNDWTPIVTNKLAYGTNAFTDPACAAYPNRYYRARSQ